MQLLRDAECELGGSDTFLVRLGNVEPWPRAKTRPLATLIKSTFPTALVEALDDDDVERRNEAVPFVWRLQNADYDRLRTLLRIPHCLPPWLERVLQSPRICAVETDQPSYFAEDSASRLLPYQREGIVSGIARGGRLLIADEMGLGKSVQGIAIAKQFAPEDGPVLVICPSSLRGVWQDQLAQWSPSSVAQVIWQGAEDVNPDAGWVIVSYALLAIHKKLSLRADSQPYGVVILDECHYAKNLKANRTEAAISCIEKARRAICLSGTAVLNAAWELHPVLRSLDPHVPDFKTFTDRYFLTEDRKFGKRCFSNPIREMELHTFLRHTIMIRRLKKDVLKDLPEKRRQVVNLEAGGFKAKLKLQKEEERLFASPEDGARFHEEIQAMLLEVAEIKVAGVCEYVQGLIDGGCGKFLLFAHHRRVLDRLEAVLKQRLGENFVRIDGSTPQQRRPELVRRFQEDSSCHVALLSITALAEGQTLTSAEAVVFAELSWVPGIIEQCEARAHRLGQQGSVLVQFLLLRDSKTDLRCYERLCMKHQHAGRVLDGVAPSSFGGNDERSAHGARSDLCMGTDSGGLRAKARCRPPTAHGAHPKSRAKRDEPEAFSAAASPPKRRRSSDEEPPAMEALSARDALASATQSDGAMCVNCKEFPVSTRKGVKRGFCCNKCPNHGPWCTSRQS